MSKNSFFLTIKIKLTNEKIRNAKTCFRSSFDAEFSSYKQKRFSFCWFLYLWYFNAKMIFSICKKLKIQLNIKKYDVVFLLKMINQISWLVFLFRLIGLKKLIKRRSLILLKHFLIKKLFSSFFNWTF
jgi:hypothetical protein